MSENRNTNHTGDNPRSGSHGFVLGIPKITLSQESNDSSDDNSSLSSGSSRGQRSFQKRHKRKKSKGETPPFLSPFDDDQDDQVSIMRNKQDTKSNRRSSGLKFIAHDIFHNDHGSISGKISSAVHQIPNSLNPTTSIPLLQTHKRSKLAGLSIYTPQASSTSDPVLHSPINDKPDSINQATSPIIDFDSDSDSELQGDLSNGLNAALGDSKEGMWMPLSEPTKSPVKKRPKLVLDVSSDIRSINRQSFEAATPKFSVQSNHLSNSEDPFDIDLEDGNHTYESIRMNDLYFSDNKSKNNPQRSKSTNLEQPHIITDYYLNVPSSFSDLELNVPSTPSGRRASDSDRASDLSHRPELTTSGLKLSPPKIARAVAPAISPTFAFASVFKSFSAKVNASDNDAEDDDEDDDDDNHDESEDDLAFNSDYDNNESGSGYRAPSDQYDSDENAVDFLDENYRPNLLKISSFNPALPSSDQGSKRLSDSTPLSGTTGSRPSFSRTSSINHMHSSNQSERLGSTSSAGHDSHFHQQQQYTTPKWQKESGTKLFGKSFKIFPPTSSFRESCRRRVTDNVFNQIITTLLLTQTVLLTHQQWTVDRGYVVQGKYTWIDWVLLVFNIVYTIEIVLKSVAFCFYDDSQMFKELKLKRKRGLFKRYYDRLNKMKTVTRRQFKRIQHNGDTKDSSNEADELFKKAEQDCDSSHVNRNIPHTVTASPEVHTTPIYTRAYLRTNWHKVDFVSTVAFWISFFLSMTKKDLEHQCLLFRSLMCLKILRLLNITHGTRLILKSLRRAEHEARDVFLFLLSFWVLFAIIGVQSFKTSLRRQCVWTNVSDPTDVYLNEFQFCGSYLDPDTLKALPYIDANGVPSTQTKGFTCPVNSKCILGDNPYGGQLGFDNFLHSMEMVFVIISANTFSDIMYYTMDSDAMAASLFYIFSMFILVVWLLSLIIAVIINSYRVHRDSFNKIRTRPKNQYRFKINYPELNQKYNDFIANYSKFNKFMKFKIVFTLSIMANLIIQTTRDATFTHHQDVKLYSSEGTLTIILVVEIIARFLFFVPGGNWKIFFYSITNCLDLGLAIITFIIVLPPVYDRLGVAYYWLSVFQIIRFYRVVMMVTFVKEAWLSIFAQTKPFFDLCLFFFLTIYLCGIIIARLFEGLIPEAEYLDSDQLIMQNLPNVMLSLYTITSTENWTSILYLAQQCGENKFVRFCVAIYLIAWFMFSNMVILNIFIAIITENLGVSESEKKNKQIQQFYSKLISSLHSDPSHGVLDSLRARLVKSTDKKNLSTSQMIEQMKKFMNETSNNDSGRSGQSSPALGASHQEKEQVSKTRAYWDWLHPKLRQLPFYEEVKTVLDHLNANQKFQNLKHKSRQTNLNFVKINKDKTRGNQTSTTETSVTEEEDEARQFLRENPSFNRSLYIFTPNHHFRKLCQKIVSPGNGKRLEGSEPNALAKDIFYVLMFIATVAVVVVTCYTTPIYRMENGLHENTWNWTTKLDLFFALLFTLECAIKVIADGFLFCPNAYLRSSWDVIDFLVVISFWITFFAEIANDSIIVTVLGEVRAMKALRLLTITKRSQEYFNYAVISGAKKMITASFLSLSLLIPFAIWGLNLFNGKLGYCIDGSSNIDECRLEYSNEVFKWDVLSPNVYTQPYLEFDSFRRSIFTLFQIVSLEGWVDLLLNLVNITGRGTVPKTFASAGNSAFVVLFMFVSIVFILNLFVSVIISNYSVQTGVAYLTEQQHAWYEVKRVLSQIRPSIRKDTSNLTGLQKRCYDLITEKSKVWTGVTNFFLFIHLVGLVCEFYPSSLAGDNARYAIFAISTSGLLLHMLLTFYALGPRMFLKNKLYVFKLSIIIGAFILSIIAYFKSRTGLYSNFNKLFLVAVLLFAIPEIDILNQLLRYASASFPSLVSLVYTWLILFLVFAIALNQSFGLTRVGPNTSGNKNCRTVAKSMILLFRISFGEGWNYIMDDFALESPFCYSDSSSGSDCGNKVLAYLIFIAWNILSMYIFLNILISVVINSFSYVYHGTGPHSLLTRDEIRKFKRCWNKFDPQGSGLMDLADLPKFLSSLSGILSYKVYGENFSISKITSKWITKNSVTDPYDLTLNMNKLDEVFATIDFKEARKRRKRYNRLFIEAQLNAIQTSDGLKVQFTDILLQVGYYSRFEDNTCLTLEDYIKRYVVTHRIHKIQRKLKIEATLLMVLSRLRFKIDNKRKILESHSNNLRGAKSNRIPSIFVSDDQGDESGWESNNEDNSNPFRNQDLYRSVSLSSLNPFADSNRVSDGRSDSGGDRTNQHISDFNEEDLFDVEFKR